MWMMKAPPYIRLLLWFILRKRVSTRENLIKRGQYGPFWCHFSKNNSEYLDHLFMFFSVTIILWTSTLTHLHPHIIWGRQTTKEAWANWWTSFTSAKTRNLPLLIYWEIWKSRNRYIFHDAAAYWTSISARIIADYNSLPEDWPPHLPGLSLLNPQITQSPKHILMAPHKLEDVVVGDILHISENHYYHIQMGLGIGTNNFDELSSAYYIIKLVIEKDCHSLQIFGDSKIICDQINKITTYHTFTLGHILAEIHRCISHFDSFVCITYIGNETPLLTNFPKLKRSGHATSG